MPTDRQTAAHMLLDAIHRAASEIVTETERGYNDDHVAELLGQQRVKQVRKDRIADEVRRQVAPILETLAVRSKSDYTLGVLERKGE